MGTLGGASQLYVMNNQANGEPSGNLRAIGGPFPQEMVGLASDGAHLIALGKDRKLYLLDPDTSSQNLVVQSFPVAGITENTSLIPHDLAANCKPPTEASVFTVLVAKIGSNIPSIGGWGYLFIPPGLNNPYMLSPPPSVPPNFTQTLPLVSAPSTGYAPMNNDICAGARDLMDKHKATLKNADALNLSNQEKLLVGKLTQLCVKALGAGATFNLVAAQVQDQYPEVTACQDLGPIQDLRIGDGTIGNLICNEP